jgi:hypothetical protein
MGEPGYRVAANSYMNDMSRHREKNNSHKEGAISYCACGVYKKRKKERKKEKKEEKKTLRFLLRIFFTRNAVQGNT